MPLTGSARDMQVGVEDVAGGAGEIVAGLNVQGGVDDSEVEDNLEGLDEVVVEPNELQGPGHGDEHAEECD